MREAEVHGPDGLVITLLHVPQRRPFGARRALGPSIVFGRLLGQRLAEAARRAA